MVEGPGDGAVVAEEHTVWAAVSDVEVHGSAQMFGSRLQLFWICTPRRGIAGSRGNSLLTVFEESPNCFPHMFFFLFFYVVCLM